MGAPSQVIGLEHRLDGEKENIGLTKRSGGDMGKRELPVVA
jgi:hypothetical protein